MITMADRTNVGLKKEIELKYKQIEGLVQMRDTYFTAYHHLVGASKKFDDPVTSETVEIDDNAGSTTPWMDVLSFVRSWLLLRNILWLCHTRLYGMSIHGNTTHNGGRSTRER